MTTNTATPTVSIRDQQGGLNVPLNLDLALNTPGQVIEHLMNEQRILRQAPGGEPLAYKLARGGVELTPDEPLGNQGVQPGDVLELLKINTKGAASAETLWLG